MRRTGLIGFAALVMLLGACSPSGGGELTSKVWTFSSVKANRPSAGEAMADPANPWTIEFRDDGTFTASAECNVTRGTYEKTSAGGLSLHPGDTAYEGCPSSPQRNPFAPVMARATAFKIADGGLVVTIEDGSLVSFK